MSKIKGKVRAAAVICLMMVLTACGETIADESMPDVLRDIDVTKSPFSHITNGGSYDYTEAEKQSADRRFPYDVDAITQATLTIEGPAMKESIPLSVGEMEKKSESVVRGLYKDADGSALYEGVELYALLHDYEEAEGIRLTESAYKVFVKDSNRADIAEFTLEELEIAHEASRPVIIAYGKGEEGSDTAAPFVFDAKNESEHSAGFVEGLKNDDGCLRLVYDGLEDEVFQNAAYIYVCEEESPGFRHADLIDEEDSYGSKDLLDYVIAFRGDGLGYEIDLSTRMLETLVRYDEEGNVAEGIGYRDSYSLANNSYWYVNEYEGLKLYELLCYLGMPTYEEMGIKKARTTLVSFLASDGIASSERFSVDTLSYPDAFSFYNKNAADKNDGTYQPTNADLVDSGYPVLLAYGFNNYPYVMSKKDAGYLSGLGNSGGPFRVIFGKSSYNHANGSNQVQFLSDVIVGEDVLYNTHLYTTEEAQAALAASPLPISLMAAGKEISGFTDFTVGQLEDLIYGKKVSAKDRKSADIKLVFDSMIYEGLDLSYLLGNTLELPFYQDTAKIKGSVRIETAEETVEVALDTINTKDAILAFAKNGTPLVENEESEGFVESREMHPISIMDPLTYDVENLGGPVALIMRDEIYPSVKSITVTVDQNKKSIGKLRELAKEEAEKALLMAIPNVDKVWNHQMSAAYESFLSDTMELVIENDKESWSKTFTLAEIESYTDVLFRENYSVMDIGLCEGLDLWKFIKEVCGYDPAKKGYVPLKNKADGIFTATSPVEGLDALEGLTAYASDGYEVDLFNVFLKDGIEKGIVAEDGRVLPIMLCFGNKGYPLVERTIDEGYEEEADNAYGPLRIITERSSQASMKYCKKIVVKIPGKGKLPFTD